MNIIFIERERDLSKKREIYTLYRQRAKMRESMTYFRFTKG
jgi:hypothetical protein